ncbi:DNA repair protein rad50 [Sparganum proliferum]
MRDFLHKMEQVSPSRTTTIIECLKYAITGELPPGAKTGVSFIHDPRLAHLPEVKAKVALQVKDVRNCPLIVSRSLLATHREKSKQGTLKTLDGSIKRQLPNGDIVSLSSRCGELDREMSTSLGASKAVFENVIFCHQEESNWPLLEAKSVKQRFDDLFASSRYVKALDAIRKTRLEQEGNAKICKAELKHLSRSREEAHQVRTQRTDTQRALGAEEKKLSDVIAKLDPISADLTLYRKKYSELVQYQTEARSCESEKVQLERRLQDLLDSISNEFSGTDEDLREAIEQAEVQFLSKQDTLSRTESSLKTTQRQIESKEDQRSGLLVKKTRLEVEIKRINEATERRNELIGRLAKLLSLTELAGRQALTNELRAEDITEVKHTLQASLRNAEERLAGIKVSTAGEEKQAQTEVDEARAALVRVEQSIAAAETALKENARESAEVKRKLARAKTFSAELEEVNQKLKEASEAREALEALSDAADKEALDTLAARRAEAEASLAGLDAKIGALQRSAMANHERDMLLKNRQSKVDAVRKLRSRHLDMLEQLFAGQPVPQVCTALSSTEDPAASSGSDLPRQFSRRFADLVASAKETQLELNKLERERSSVEAALSFQRKQLHEKQDAARQMEERLLSACGSVDLERHIDKLLLKKKQLASECANDEGSLYLWNKFRDRLAHESECPLCHRNFDNDNDYEDLKNELEQKITSMPRDLQSKKRELENIEKQHQNLIELRPVSQDFLGLQETELPALKAKVDSSNARLEELKGAIDKEATKLEFIQADQSIAQSLQGDIAVMEKFEKEIADMSRSIQRLKPDSNTDGEGSQSLDDLHAQRDALRASCEELSEEIEQVRRKLEAHLTKKQQAINVENSLRDAQHRLEREHQATSNLNSELERLASVNSRLSEELRDWRAQLPSCSETLTSAEARRQEILEARDESLAVAQAETQEWRDRIREFEEVCSAAQPLRGHTRETYDDIVRQLLEFDSGIASLKDEVVTSSEKLNDLRKAIANHKIYQRELQDCVRLRDVRSQLASTALRVKTLQSKIAEYQSSASGATDLLQHVNSLSSQEDRLRKQKQLVVDRVTQLQTELKMLERSLAEKYADAETEYVKKVYEVKTAEMAATDLELFYHALDRAIMSYHAAKMAEVNQIIRDLWRTTYRGNDIDYIEICSEEEPFSTSGANATKQRRTYNYRVVMVKASSVPVASGSQRLGGGGRSNKSVRLSSEARLDMRGRCSAGQKVLASLVIRLALAEVFCLQCGVLALDEPTTNLDRENIESLAYALTEIIKTRSGQRNFQLIVITHDEDFVELLGRADCASHLFRISRNLQGLSEIEKVRIEDQFH